MDLYYIQNWEFIHTCMCTLGHSNMIHCLPFHQKAWGMQAGGSLLIITLRTCIRAPETLTIHTKATVRRDKNEYTNAL